MAKKSERMLDLESKIANREREIMALEERLIRVNRLEVNSSEGNKVRDNTIADLQAQLSILRAALDDERQALEVVTVEHVASSDYSDN